MNISFVHFLFVKETMVCDVKKSGIDFILRSGHVKFSLLEEYFVSSNVLKVPHLIFSTSGTCYILRVEYIPHSL